MGKNDYLKEFKLFNPWIIHTGEVTWVPETRLHTKCVIKVRNIFLKEFIVTLKFFFVVNLF